MSNDIDLIKIKAIEQRVFQNLSGVLEQQKTMEKLVQQQAEEIKALRGQLHSMDGTVGELRKQLSLLQQQFYAKGTTSYGDNSELVNKGGNHTAS